MSVAPPPVNPFPSALPRHFRLRDLRVEYNVHPAIAWAEPLVAYAFARHGREVVLTSAKDGKHSEQSRHFWKPGDPRPAQAVDIRLLNPRTGRPWFSRAVLTGLVEELDRVLRHLSDPGKGHYTLLAEPDHLHLEWNPPGIPANVRGYVFGREVYGP